MFSRVNALVCEWISAEVEFLQRSTVPNVVRDLGDVCKGQRGVSWMGGEL